MAFVETLLPTGSASTDTAAVLDAVVKNRGVLLGPGRFVVNRRIVLPAGGYCLGLGAGVTEIAWGGSSETTGIVVSKSIDAGSGDIDDHVHLGGFSLIPNQAEVGIHVACAYLDLRDIWATQFKQTGCMLDTTKVAGTGAVHNRVRDCRFEAGTLPGLEMTGAMTDMVVDEIVFLKPDKPKAGVPDLHATNTGGGSFRNIHTNGSAGSCIRLDRAMCTEVGGVYHDGWGTWPVQGETYASVDIGQLVSGGGSTSLNINTLRNRARGTVGGTASATYVDVRVGGGMSGVVDIEGVTAYIRDNAGPIKQSERFVLDLHSTHAYTLRGINADVSGGGAYSQIYRGSKPPNCKVAASSDGV